MRKKYFPILRFSYTIRTPIPLIPKLEEHTVKNPKKALRKAKDKAAKARRQAEARSKRGLPTTPPFTSQPRGKHGRCDLCLEEKPLVRSHIIPKANVRAGGKFQLFTDRECSRIKEDDAVRLFCRECDGKFSTVEGRFVTWWRTLALNSPRVIAERMNFVDSSGEWSDLSGMGRTTLTIKDADLNLLRKMMLINIFRERCRFSALGNRNATQDAHDLRYVVNQILNCGEAESNAICHQFSIKAMYTHMPIDGKVFPQLVKPFLGGGDGSCFIDGIGDFRCWSAPILWVLYMPPDERDKGEIEMQCCNWKNVITAETLANARKMFAKTKTPQ